IKTMFVFGLLGLFLTWADVPLAPFLLGVILGPMLDENLRRGLELSKGSFAPMFQRPICIFFFIVILFMIASKLGVFRAISAMRNKNKENE
ncbi:MAG: transporter, partial [Spirochaetales bacterium]|nr:transporter [Candidatus Physcosoma equi]